MPSYWAQAIPAGSPEGLDGSVVGYAKVRPAGTVRVMYQHAVSFGRGVAFVNNPDDSLLWKECEGCYAVEDQCPEHGHLQ